MEDYPTPTTKKTTILQKQKTQTKPPETNSKIKHRSTIWSQIEGSSTLAHTKPTNTRIMVIFYFSARMKIYYETLIVIPKDMRGAKSIMPLIVINLK